MVADSKRKCEYYDAMIICIDAGIAYANRYADLAEKMAETESDSVRKSELQEIACLLYTSRCV